MASTSYQRQQAPPYNSDDDGLNSDEEEEERHLSALHGEAADDTDTTSKKRKRTNDTKLTEEDAAAAKEFEEKIRKKIARPQFTPQLLTSGTKGLVYLRRSFPSRVAKFRVPMNNKVNPTSSKMDKKQQDLYNKRRQTSQINMAARYSSSLMAAYNEFARNIFPSLAPADVFLKIEAMGSKKEVKDFLNVMRDDVRKEYMVKVYEGDVEKVDRFLSEVDMGINAGGVGANALMGGGDEDDGDYQQEVEINDGTAATTPRLGIRADAETELPTAPSVTPLPVANPYRKSVVNDNAETADVSSPIAGKELEQEEELTVEKEEEDQNLTSTNEDDEAEFEETLELSDKNKAAEVSSPTAEKEMDEGELPMENDGEEMTDKNVEENATNDDVILPEEEVASQINEPSVEDTQETLTLVETQDDERFSQAMTDDALVAEASQDEPEQDEEENDERFSQVNTSMEEDVIATQDDNFSQEENTLEERFSQVTDRVTFEEGTFTQDHGSADDEVQQNSATLGQMTSTQLSMEY